MCASMLLQLSSTLSFDLFPFLNNVVFRYISNTSFLQIYIISNRTPLKPFTQEYNTPKNEFTISSSSVNEDFWILMKPIPSDNPHIIINFKAIMWTLTSFLPLSPNSRWFFLFYLEMWQIAAEIKHTDTKKDTITGIK